MTYVTLCFKSVWGWWWWWWWWWWLGGGRVWSGKEIRKMQFFGSRRGMQGYIYQLIPGFEERTF